MCGVNHGVIGGMYSPHVFGMEMFNGTPTQNFPVYKFDMGRIACLLSPPPSVLDQIIENVVEFYIVYCDNIDNTLIS